MSDDPDGFRAAFREMGETGVLFVVLVACVGGVAAPWVTAGVLLGAFHGEGTWPGVLLVTFGVLLGLSLGIALVEPTLNLIERRRSDG